MGIDPRELGCHCDECPLGQFHRENGTWKPVLSERSTSRRAVIAEAPGVDEVITGRPLIGPSGRELMRGLKLYGIERGDVTLSNSILCQPPLNDMGGFLHQLSKENKKRKAAGLKPRISPVEACRPQLLRQAWLTPDILVLGGTPYQSLMGRRHPVRKIRGALIDHLLEQQEDGQYQTMAPKPGMEEALDERGQHLHVVPTVHPAFVLRAAQWREWFVQDIGRWNRWLTNTLQDMRPNWRWAPSPNDLEAFLFDPTTEFHLVDIETGGVKDPVTKKVVIDARDTRRCFVRVIGFGTIDGRVMVVPFRSITGDTTLDGKPDPTDPVAHLYPNPMAFYSTGDACRIRQIIIRFLLDPQRMKAGHHVIGFDWDVLVRVLKLPRAPGPVFDTIIAMARCFTEMPRDLYTLGTRFTDIGAWKAAADDRKIASDPRTNMELGEYNATDCKVNAACVPALVDLLTRRRQWAAVEVDHQLQEIGRQMSAIGLRVHQGRQAKLEAESEQKKSDTLALVRGLTGNPKFNPLSNAHLGSMLYDDWKIPVLGLTDTGDPSTDDKTIRKMFLYRVLTPGQKEIMDLVRVYREVSKLLGTYVRKFKPGMLCDAQGYLHPKYTVHGPRTGRMSSRGPNAQNFLAQILECIIPPEGCTFVYADYDQIELRIFAAIAAIESYLKVFRDKGDPHSVTASVLYGKTFERELEIKKQTGEKTKLFTSLRRLAKVFIFALIYGGSASTIWESVSSAEDPETGKLLFPDMPLSEIQVIYNRFMQNLPEIPILWEKQCTFAQDYGYIDEPVLGRRRDFATFERNEVLNMPIQSSAAAIAGMGTIRVTQRVPFDHYAKTGLVNFCHDADLVACRTPDAPWVEEAVKEAMYARYEDRLPGVEFTVKVKRGDTWAEAAA